MTRASFEDFAKQFSGIPEQHDRIAQALGAAKALRTLSGYRERGIPGLTQGEINAFMDQGVGDIISALGPTSRNRVSEDVIAESKREHDRIMRDFERRQDRDPMPGIRGW